MDKATGCLTVYFENPFWVGVFERRSGGMVQAARHVFGAEPTGREILDFVTNHYDKLKFSPAIADDAKEKRINPKRSVREARKQNARTGTGTKSQEALKMQHEQFKKESRILRRETKEMKALHRFELKQQKKKLKHCGK